MLLIYSSLPPKKNSIKVYTEYIRYPYRTSLVPLYTVSLNMTMCKGRMNAIKRMIL